MTLRDEQKRRRAIDLVCYILAQKCQIRNGKRQGGKWVGRRGNGEEPRWGNCSYDIRGLHAAPGAIWTAPRGDNRSKPQKKPAPPRLSSKRKTGPERSDALKRRTNVRSRLLWVLRHVRAEFGAARCVHGVAWGADLRHSLRSVAVAPFAVASPPTL